MSNDNLQASSPERLAQLSSIVLGSSLQTVHVSIKEPEFWVLRCFMWHEHKLLFKVSQLLLMISKA